MRIRHISRSVTMTLSVAVLGIFHSAIPVAVSAQGAATMTVSVTVVDAGAVWNGIELANAVLSATMEGDLSRARAGVSTDQPSSSDALADASRALRMERDGTVVWAERLPAPGERMRVTIAHLGS